jgi:hypothetical protein
MKQNQGTIRQEEVHAGNKGLLVSSFEAPAWGSWTGELEEWFRCSLLYHSLQSDQSNVYFGLFLGPLV